MSQDLDPDQVANAEVWLWLWVARDNMDQTLEALTKAQEAMTQASAGMDAYGVAVGQVQRATDDLRQVIRLVAHVEGRLRKDTTVGSV